MDLKSAPLLIDPVPTNKSRLGCIPVCCLAHHQRRRFLRALYLTIPRRKPIPGKLDDVRANSWLNDMKSSSPRKMLNKDSNIEAVSDENDAAYHLWVLKYPSALTSFEQIMKCAEGKRIALFMDYDGTLSPIIEDPDTAIMSSEKGSRSSKCTFFEQGLNNLSMEEKTNMKEPTICLKPPPPPPAPLSPVSNAQKAPANFPSNFSLQVATDDSEPHVNTECQSKEPS